MEIFFEESFEKDLRKIKDKKALQSVRAILTQVKNAQNIREIANLKKLKGYEAFYRIRFGDYRLGVEVTENKIIFARCLHRKDIYKHFPKG